jgi:hypothetical protein
VSVADPLYARYKALALSAGAALLLERPDAELIADAQRLAADARAALAEHPDQTQALAACAAAADALAQLPDGLDASRATYRTLRAAMFAAGACEYVPCGTHAHAHQEALHG